MAKRPIFVPRESGPLLVQTVFVNFDWFPGLSVAQKQKSINSLHCAASREIDGIKSILEISSKSQQRLGVALSAFNLKVKLPSLCQGVSVECVFQGSKLFENGGPFTDLYLGPSLAAKKDERLQNSGKLVGFQCEGFLWPLEPKTTFYDWLYLNALSQDTSRTEELLSMDAFTDIEFNPERSFNCQAFSAGLYVALKRRGVFDAVLRSEAIFIQFMKEHSCPWQDFRDKQCTLPF